MILSTRNPAHQKHAKSRKRVTAVTSPMAILGVGVVVAYFFFSFQQDLSMSHHLLSSSTQSPTTHVSTLKSIDRQYSQKTKCKYHGNCPSNTVCENGVCIPFMPTNNITSNHSQQHERCVQTCLEELVKDEYFYHGTEPKIVRTFPSKSPLSGCVIQFERQRVSQPPKNIGTFHSWIDTRLRNIVRVDMEQDMTMDSNKNPDFPLVWNAYCSPSCKSDTDCPSGNRCIGRPEQRIASPVPIHSEPKSCHTSATSHNKHPEDMIIVTGSDSAYYSALQNFAASLQYWAPTRKLVIYNLGMTNLQLKNIKKWINLHALHWESGIPTTLPPHVNNLKNYAWKSIIINETVHEYKSIFWLDAGATFTGNIDSIEEIIHRNGIFLVRGQDEDMKRLSHPRTYQALGYEKETFRKGLKSPHFAGGIQGHVYPSRFIDSLVIPNAKCALDPDCIAPTGSSLGNHRYDQTSLSILAYQTTVQATHYTEYLAAGRDQLNADLFQPSEKIMWTSRGSCNFYYQNVQLKV
ncbi:DUF1647 domain containing protein [Nitzschia inconspicua]|uniref:DUF1647 domain containing protein n=1 Tax=Nitzschia inconspicua TaxID=303405 RepID=A0A9K3PJ91_9STRA|nr:DUF1647 domain containing protein [Nitzschia inconspicua]